MSSIIPRRHSRIDLAGIMLSAVCMLHCMLLPVVVLAGVGADMLWHADQDWTHQVMLALVIPISGLALAGGWVRHRRPRVLMMGIAGVALLAFAALYAHDHLGVAADALLTTMGGGLLAIAHWRNRDCPCPSTLQQRELTA